MTPFTTFGGGRTKVLVLPGLLGGAAGFSPMLDYADPERFQYVVMHYRGFGPAIDMPGLYILREVVVDAVRILDYLGWRSTHLVGHSVGALIAQMVAMAAPARVASIVSVAGMSARGAPRDASRAVSFAKAATDRNVCAQMAAAGTGGRYTPSFGSRVADLTVAKVLPAAISHYIQDAQDPATSDIHDQVIGSQLPFLALVGRHDPGNTEALARDTTLRWYPKAKLEVLDAGHYPMMECPVITASLIERFLSDVEASAAASKASDSIA